MSRKEDNLQKTRATYTKIALNYARSNRDRSKLDKHLARFLSLLKVGDWVLDVGCGPGFDTAVFQTHNLHTVALDYTHEMMQAGQQALGVQANFAQADMRQLPFAQQFDALWASASILHLAIEDVPNTLQQFRRVLHPDGVLYLSTKLGEGSVWDPISYGQEEPRHFTYWQPDALDTLLQNVGFVIEEGWIDSGRDRWIVRFARKK